MLKTLIVWFALELGQLWPTKLQIDPETVVLCDITWTICDPVDLLAWVFKGVLRELGIPIEITRERIAVSILPAEDPLNGGQMFLLLTQEVKAEAARIGLALPEDLTPQKLYSRFLETVKVLVEAASSPEGLEHMEDLRGQIALVPGGVQFVRQLATISSQTGSPARVVIFTAWGQEVARLLVNLLGLGDLGLRICSSAEFPRTEQGVLRDKDDPQTFFHFAKVLNTSPAKMVLLDDSPAVCLAAVWAGVRTTISPRNPFKNLADYHAALRLAWTKNLQFSVVRDLQKITIVR